MQVPKNNLEEVLRRRAEVELGADSNSAISKTNSAKNKFKPANGVSSSPSNISVRKPNLPSFSTPGFPQPQLSNKPSNVTPGAVVYISDDSGLSSPGIIKRTSSDMSISYDPSPQPTKRTKKNTQAQKENFFHVLDTSQLQGKGKSLSHTPLVQPITDDEPWLRMPPDPERNPFARLTRDFPMQAASISCKQPSFSHDNSDLLSKDSETLNTFLLGDHELLKIITDLELSHYINNYSIDIILLQSVRSIIDGRINGIKNLVALRKAESSSTIGDFQVQPASVLPKHTTFSSESIMATTLCDPSSSRLVGSSAVEEISRVGGSKICTPDVQIAATPMEEDDNELLEPLPGSDDLWEGMDDFPVPDSDRHDITPISEKRTFISGTSDPRASLYYGEILDKLRTVFGLKTFRPNQLEAITATLSGQDVFVLMPTGGGKSLCYQLPAVCRAGKTQGVTVIVSPLVALMKDQVQALQSKKVDVYLWSAESSWEEARQRLRAAKKPDLLYITPEKLKESGSAQSILEELYKNQRLARFVIDEAHCISTWGQDFREAYKCLDTLRSRFPLVPIMALTATATRVAIDDIVKHLALRRDYAFFKQSFNRPNLTYSVQVKSMKWFDSMVEFISCRHPQKAGIIYCLGRDKCEEVARKLNEIGFRASHFHAGMTPGNKDATLEDWKNGQILIIVATIAFGMGIDKPDVRFVIHQSLPKSLDGYYQETGRAGRDGKPADCVLYFHFKDFITVRNMIERPDRDNVFPTQESIDRQTTAARAVVDYCMNISDCRRVRLLQYFDEKFDRAKCGKSCDNCANPDPLTCQDVTQEARHAVDLVKRVQEKSIPITLALCRDVLRGANNQQVRNKQLDSEALHGCARELASELLEQVLQRLCSMDILRLESRQQENGFHVEYLRLGPATERFLRKNEKLILQWRPKSSEIKTRKHKSQKEKPTKRGRPKVIRSGPIGMSDQEPYASSEENDVAADSGQSQNRSGPSRLPELRKEVIEGDIPEPATWELSDPVDDLYHKMCDRRRELMAQHGLSDPQDVLDDLSLQLLSASRPQDYTSFKSILKQVAEDEMSEVAATKHVEEKFERYGADFLVLCVEVRCDPEPIRKAPSLDRILRSRFIYQNPVPHSFSATAPTIRRSKFKPAPPF